MCMNLACKIQALSVRCFSHDVCCNVSSFRIATSIAHAPSSKLWRSARCLKARLVAVRRLWKHFLPGACAIELTIALYLIFLMQPAQGRPCAAGKLYSPENDTIAGLQPAHFVTMATPHLGVAGQGDYKVSTCAQAFVMLA